jgi:hypothetical protein
MNTNLIKDADFKAWLVELKTRILQSQVKAAIKVNSELLRLYWDLGHDIVVRQMEAVWGSGFFEQLSKELKAEFPAMSGFSATNLKYCKYFYQFYSQGNIIHPQLGDELENTNFLRLGGELEVTKNQEVTIRPQVGDELEVLPVFQIPWGHHKGMIKKTSH